MPPWTKKDRDKYEHIKDSVIDSGAPEERAKEIAGRTVNKDRREEGRTPNKTTQGTGNPNKPLAELTRDELYNQAKELEIAGRSKLSKSELIEAIKKTV